MGFCCDKLTSEEESFQTIYVTDRLVMIDIVGMDWAPKVAGSLRQARSMAKLLWHLAKGMFSMIVENNRFAGEQSGSVLGF